MRKRSLKGSQMSARRPLPQQSLSRGGVSRVSGGGALSRYRHISPMYWNIVQSWRLMSSQNAPAENLSRMTTEPPLTRTAPVATAPPTL